ncbi:MAG: hypothetical protein H7840_16620 [Alphaproteobacteria bacterium]
MRDRRPRSRFAAAIRAGDAFPGDRVKDSPELHGRNGRGSGRRDRLAEIRGLRLAEVVNGRRVAWGATP